MEELLSILEQIGIQNGHFSPLFANFPHLFQLFPTFPHFSPFFPTFHYFFQLLATFPTVSHFSQLFPNFPHFLPLFSTFCNFSHIKPLNHIKPLRIFLRYLLMQHLIKFCIKHIDSNSYSIYAMACLYTIRGYTQYLPTGKYTNSSYRSWQQSQI